VPSARSGTFYFYFSVDSGGFLDYNLLMEPTVDILYFATLLTSFYLGPCLGVFVYDAFIEGPGPMTRLKRLIAKLRRSKASVAGRDNLDNPDSESGNCPYLRLVEVIESNLEEAYPSKAIEQGADLYGATLTPIDLRGGLTPIDLRENP